jgi:hypothetical protein
MDMAVVSAPLHEMFAVSCSPIFWSTDRIHIELNVRRHKESVKRPAVQLLGRGNGNVTEMFRRPRPHTADKPNFVQRLLAVLQEMIDGRDLLQSAVASTEPTCLQAFLVRAVVGLAVRQARVLARINFRPLQTAQHARPEILDIRGALKLRDPELGYSAKLVLYVHASHLGQNDFDSYLHGSHRTPEPPPCSS